VVHGHVSPMPWWYVWFPMPTKCMRVDALHGGRGGMLRIEGPSTSTDGSCVTTEVDAAEHTMTSNRKASAEWRRQGYTTSVQRGIPARALTLLVVAVQAVAMRAVPMRRALPGSRRCSSFLDRRMMGREAGKGRKGAGGLEECGGNRLR